LFLTGFTWVDLRSGLTEDGLNQLIWGITGSKHGQSLGNAEDPREIANDQNTGVTQNNDINKKIKNLKKNTLNSIGILYQKISIPRKAHVNIFLLDTIPGEVFEIINNSAYYNEGAKYRDSVEGNLNNIYKYDNNSEEIASFIYNILSSYVIYIENNIIDSVNEGNYIKKPLEENFFNLYYKKGEYKDMDSDEEIDIGNEIIGYIKKNNLDNEFNDREMRYNRMGT